MANQFINFNGEIHPADQPVMTIQNRGFRYGDGLFESMRMMKGEIKFASLHIERLQKGMAALKFEGSSYIDPYFLNEQVAELARRNYTGPDARVRLIVYREAGGLYSPASNKFGYSLEVNKVDDSLYVADPKGFIADVFEDVPKPINTLSNYKTCNSLVYVLAGIFKNRFSLDEVFILNQNGLLCEAMTSNVFLVIDKKIYTPALTEGCIAGVMRSVVIELAKDNNLPVTEAQIDPAILTKADEIFITNASRGIQWIMGMGKKRYFNEVSRSLLDKLNGV